jgi:hypothetical protein
MKWIPLATLLFVACGSTTPEGPATDPRIERTERDSFGLLTCSESTPDRTCFTHRSIIGVSMGAHGAGQIGFSRPELFDSVGMLGVPLVDWVYMLRNIRRSYMGGFCDRETILANLDRLNDPMGPAFCGPVVGTDALEPSAKIIEPSQDFNHWYRWIDNGRGGSFGRNKLRESLQDIALAFGNALYYNPASPYYPPGLPMNYRGQPDSEVCTRPVVLKGVKHKEYNPDGSYDVIAFCDTDTNEGEFDPARPSEKPMQILLAVDYNANGLRDYAEPILSMIHERFEDVGSGPNDQFDWQRNPAGKGQNWLWDEGEPFEDNGLDGVPGTGDYGEGNGKFDWNPNTDTYFELNPRFLAERMSDGHMDRMSIWADAGIRDFLFSAGGMNWFWSSLQTRLGKGVAKDYTRFESLMPPGSESFDFLKVDYSPESLGKHAYVRYGDPNATEREIMRGDGHHVGTPEQVLNRFLTAMHFIQSRFFEGDYEGFDEVEDIVELIRPKTFFSDALGRERKYGIVFPPGYNDPKNANKRYPVMYFLHGQGQESQDLLASAILFFGYMAGSTTADTVRRHQSDWAKFIIVFPDSTCDMDACDSGNFNTNHKGIDGNGPRYMDSIFELMAHVEREYRTRIPVEVPR